MKKNSNEFNDSSEKPERFETEELPEESLDNNYTAGIAGESAEASERAESGEEDEISSLKRKLEESKNDYLRLAAEFDNYKKRTARDIAGIIKGANEKLIVELLDVLDNFERAFKSREENPDFEAYHKGVKLLYDRFSEILNRQGLSKFESLGEKFDARLHEAVMQTESPEAEPDTVAMEFQPGYRLDDKVIRHARVGVVTQKSGS